MEKDKKKSTKRESLQKSIKNESLCYIASCWRYHEQNNAEWTLNRRKLETNGILSESTIELYTQIGSKKKRVYYFIIFTRKRIQKCKYKVNAKYDFKYMTNLNIFFCVLHLLYLQLEIRKILTTHFGCYENYISKGCKELNSQQTKVQYFEEVLISW